MLTSERSSTPELRLRARLRATLPDAEVERVELPGTPIRLCLIQSDYQTGPLDPEVMRAVVARPAYWSFCWGSGLALARRIIGWPETVRGRTVIDLGCGSGVVAIAAALAGAARVYACDNDADALHAARCNAEVNSVTLEYTDRIDALPKTADLLYMADVLYDKANLGLIEAAKTHAARTVIADSRITDVEDPEFRPAGTASGLTLPNLGEFDHYRTVRFFQFDRLDAS